ncbi:MAG: thioredoxin [Anaerolineae bacterium]|nr:thioredoxin [Anaerolineae bacterium]MDW8102905.1 thioredoxin [Anaerolineae bacterium]
MTKPLEVNAEAFKKEVLEEKIPVLVDFWAEWCGPCRMLAPLVEEIAIEMGDKLKVVKINVDQNPSVAVSYGIMSIPTLILFKGGKPVEKLIGYMPKAKLLEAINRHLEG